MQLHSACFQKVVLFFFATTVLSAVSVGFAQEEYEIQFQGRWINTIPRPGGAHFTQIVGATHNAAGTLFEVGQEASVGVENVAETGSTSVLIAEINSAISAGNADSLILGTDTFITAEETNTFRFFANDSHTQLSFLTMIAPSPDWFVGVHDLDLQDSAGNWRESVILDLNNYDAGTENGSGFSLNNSATNPRGVITGLDFAEPGGVLFGSGSIARVSITRISSVPEPGSTVVLGAAFMGLVMQRRKQRIS